MATSGIFQAYGGACSGSDEIAASAIGSASGGSTPIAPLTMKNQPRLIINALIDIDLVVELEPHDAALIEPADGFLGAQGDSHSRLTLD